jgi:hypothetical protein
MAVQKDKEELSSSAAFSQQFDSSTLRLRTIMVGQVVAFDPIQNTVDVQPCIKRKFIKDKKAGNLPIINDVPVGFFGAGNFWLTIEPQEGDYCVLLISDRSIERWKLTGGITDPQLKRHHDMTDAIAYFGINPFEEALPDVQTSAIHIRTRDGESGIKLEADTATIHIGGDEIVKVTSSEVVISLGGTSIATITSGNVAFTVNVTAPDFITDTGISLRQHTHIDSVGGNTSVPL